MGFVVGAAWFRKSVRFVGKFVDGIFAAGPGYQLQYNLRSIFLSDLLRHWLRFFCSALTHTPTFACWGSCYVCFSLPSVSVPNRGGASPLPQWNLVLPVTSLRHRAIVALKLRLKLRPAVVLATTPFKCHIPAACRLVQHAQLL